MLRLPNQQLLPHAVHRRNDLPGAVLISHGIALVPIDDDEIDLVTVDAVAGLLADLQRQAQGGAP